MISLAIALAIGVYYTQGISVSYAIPKLVSMSLLAVAVTVFSPRTIVRKQVWVFSLLFLLTATASSLLNPGTIIPSLFGLYGTHNGGLLQMVIIGLLFVCAPKRDDVVIGVVNVALLSAIYVWAQSEGVTGFAPFPISGGRHYGVLGSPVYDGALMALAVPLVNHKRFHVLSPTLVCLFVGIYLTGTRAAMIAAVIALAVKYWRPGQMQHLAASAAILFGLLLGGAYAVSKDISLREQGRILVYQTALKGIADKPLLGSGPATFYFTADKYKDKKWEDVYGSNMQAHAHNDYLEVASTMGGVGLCFYLLLTLFVLKGTYHDRAIFAGLIAIWITSKTNPTPFAVQCAVAMLAGSLSKRSFMPIHRRGLYRYAALAIASLCLMLSLYVLANERLLFYYANSYNQGRAVLPSARLGLQY